MQQTSLVEHTAKQSEVKERPTPPLVEVNGQSLQFINVVRIGPITWVHLIEPKTGIHGFGGSKQSPQDKFNYEHGLLIALGRAEKATRVKKAGKTISHPYMA